MKKQHKKEQQVQAKSWKVWFYTLWLPLIVSFLLLVFKLGSYLQCRSVQARGIFLACKSIDFAFFLNFTISFFILYFLYNIFLFFLGKKYFSWKIFLGTLFVILIILFLGSSQKSSVFNDADVVNWKDM